MAPTADVIAEFIDDHRRADRLLIRIKALPWGDPRRRRLIGEAIVVLSRHAGAEARFLDPLLRLRVDEGADLAGREQTDRTRLDRLLGELSTARSSGPQADALVSRVLFDFRDHAERQERVLFPALREAASAADLDLVGARLRAARRATQRRSGVQLEEPSPADRLIPSRTPDAAHPATGPAHVGRFGGDVPPHPAPRTRRGKKSPNSAH